jgi:hypothetical protein
MPILRSAVFGLVVVTAICAQDRGTSYVFRVPLPIAPAVHDILEQEFDILHEFHAPGVDPQIVVMPEELERFKALVPNAVELRRGRPFRETWAEYLKNAPEPPDPGYFTVPEVIAEMDAQVAAFPNLAQRVDLSTLPGAAKTHNNQSIWALKVSDNVASDEDEPAIVIASQHHARELNSTFMVIGAFRRALQGYATDPALKAVVDSYEIFFVPTVNPDGTDWVWSNDENWRKNRRNNGGGIFGVDNNRNYPFLWGMCGASTLTSSQTYQGPSPGSEPENKTMRALNRAVAPEVYLDFHSSGQEVLFMYAPCATVGSTLQSFVSSYVNDLRAPMSYNTRLPSASGEAPEDHWASTGALSFLIEIGTSFQPVFTVTQAEEVRVWPGVRRVLTTWRPAVRGHVRSIFQGQPVEATIKFTPNLFAHGEQTLSRARDGRYGLWLPVGTWSVTWSAPGFQSQTRSVNVTSLNAPQTIEIELVPAWQPATLQKVGSDRIGTTTRLDYSSPGDNGDLYWIALSGGTSPGIPVGSRTIPLNADGFFAASLSAAPLLTGNLGTLPASGQASALLNIPAIPAIVGVSFFSAGITFAGGYPDGVKKFSAAVPITIQP